MLLKAFDSSHYVKKEDQSNQLNWIFEQIGDKMPHCWAMKLCQVDQVDHSLLDTITWFLTGVNPSNYSYPPPLKQFSAQTPTTSEDQNVGDDTDHRRVSTVSRMSGKQLLSLVEKRINEKRKRVVQKFISALTLHGYVHFHNASGVRKILWALILITMLVFIVRLTYLSYRSENYYKQVIEFETKKLIELDFPTITFCSYVPMFTDEIFDRFPIKITKEEFKRFYYNVISNLGKRQNDSQSRLGESEFLLLQKLEEKGYNSYKNVLELFEKHSEKDIHSMLVRRVMRKNRCLIENKPCVFKNLFKTVYRHKSQSLCLQFNSYEIGKHSLVSTGKDQENGLSMFWDISGQTYTQYSTLNGLLMEIHPYGTPHHIIDHRRAIYLEPGVFTNIDIEEVMTKRLKKPFKPNCEEKERRILIDYPYSQVLCELECSLGKALRECGCIPDQFIDHARNARGCNITEMKCIFDISSSLHCHDCPVQCNEYDYKISTSRLGIGNDWVYKAIKGINGWENKSQTEIKSYINQNIVGFRIGFLSLEKQVRRYKEAVPWYERISMLGGMMGLLLGFSVITGFEFLFFLFDYLYITLKYRCTQEYLSSVLQQQNLKTRFQRTVKSGLSEKEKGSVLD